MAAFAQLSQSFERLQREANLRRAAQPTDSIRHMDPQELREFSVSLFRMINRCLATDPDEAVSESMVGEGDEQPSVLIPSLRSHRPSSITEMSLLQDTGRREASIVLTPSMRDRESDNSYNGSESGGQEFRMSKSMSSRVGEDGYEYVNDFMVVDQIGRGQYGKVLLAIRDEDDEPVAIKVVPRKALVQRKPFSGSGSPKRFGASFSSSSSSSSSDSSRNDGNAVDLDIEALQREVAIMKKLRHKNIVQLFECIDDEEEGLMYMVMQYVDRGPLFTVDERGTCPRMEVSKIRHYFRQLIDGLSYLERCGVLHLDIKPDNILLSSDDTVYLADFGMSEVIEQTPENLGMLSPSTGDGLLSPSRKPLTPRGPATQRGTPAFMAPEMCEGSEVITTAADVWSLGVTLYCMLVGSLPFKASSWRETTTKIMEEEPGIPTDIDPQWVDLLLGMLHKDAEKRSTLAALRRHPLLQIGRLASLDISGTTVHSATMGGPRDMFFTPRESFLEISTADIQSAFTSRQRKKDKPVRRRSITGARPPLSATTASIDSLFTPKIVGSLSTAARTPTKRASRSLSLHSKEKKE